MNPAATPGVLLIENSSVSKTPGFSPDPHGSANYHEGL
jgi:hypothetical protein